ncbi:TPA: hypothetical protein ACHTCR_005200 [Pseudomonas putida]|uniref:DUF4852 domain-containing protein n=1 Tax=Pseudomonas monteilii TaxID=76759 RepID=A0AAP7KEA7_9PSED|nr:MULTISPECIES: hypothetical protein [Pseudomonas putida group]OAH45972.1 hypothetical protein AYJ70_28550 [Pseudomonas monteilii]RNF69059.1 hypothetical protein EFJ98_18385 [Pseudomonas putida]
MSSLKPDFVRSIALASAIASALLLVGCKDEKEAPKEAKKQVETAAKVDEPTFESLNNTLVAKFSNPGEGQPESYLDILYPATAFRLYNSYRTWDETGQDIAEFLKTSVPSDATTAEVFQLGREYGDTTDEFKKRDLSEKISAQTKAEAEKVNGNRLVKFLSVPTNPVSLELGKYNFDEKSFKIDHCLFSDKLKYTKEEARLAQSMKGADQERCYFRTTNTELRVGFVGGSDVRFKVEDSDLARKIEGERGNLKIEVFGYVDSVERERVGGNLVKERTVLIAPQKLLLIDSSDKVIFETKI